MTSDDQTSHGYKNAQMLNRIIEEEDVSILGGFSQGGHFASFLAIHYLQQKFLATFSLSGGIFDMK